ARLHGHPPGQESEPHPAEVRAAPDRESESEKRPEESTRPKRAPWPARRASQGTTTPLKRKPRPRSPTTTAAARRVRPSTVQAKMPTPPRTTAAVAASGHRASRADPTEANNWEFRVTKPTVSPASRASQMSSSSTWEMFPTVWQTSVNIHRIPASNVTPTAAPNMAAPIDGSPPNNTNGPKAAASPLRVSTTSAKPRRNRHPKCVSAVVGCVCWKDCTAHVGDVMFSSVTPWWGNDSQEDERGSGAYVLCARAFSNHPSSRRSLGDT